MRPPELFAPVAAVTIAGLATIAITAKLVVDTWITVSGAPVAQEPATYGAWVWLVVAVAAVCTTLWAVRRLRDVLRARSHDEPALWI